MEFLNQIDTKYRQDFEEALKLFEDGEAVLYKLLKNNPVNVQELNRYLNELEVTLDQYIEALIYFDKYLVENEKSADLKRQNGYISCCLEIGVGIGSSRLVNLLAMMLMNYGLEDQH